MSGAQRALLKCRFSESVSSNSFHLRAKIGVMFLMRMLQCKCCVGNGLDGSE